ncbi:MAG: type II secretion system protein [Elusimicrobia bacterium]|nr:type II secretion system protein [Elusimicrobiota bacterium]
METFLRQRGFTLIELMIVVAIIGILAAVAIPKFADMLRKSKEGATKGSLTNLRSALTIYVSDNEGLLPLQNNATADYTSASLTAVFIPKYIEVIPTGKLGTYHNDSASVRMVGPSNRTDTSNTNDAMGWCYTSTSGGAWWVNCTHSDTKNVFFTNW